MKRPLLFLIADGMGDHPNPAHGNKTPLMAAETPHMDALAQRGLVGACRTIPPHLPPGSDVANMALLGFDPDKWHTGRGPIEAAAQGLELDPDDLIWRLNLVSISELAPQGLMLDYSAGHIQTSDGVGLIMDLCAELDGDLFQLYAGVQYRHLLVQRHGARSMEANLQIRPPHDITNQPIDEDLTEIARSPRLDKFFRTAHKVLARSSNKTKGNSVWPWGQGRRLSLPEFKETYRLQGAVISAVDVIKGLGRACRMEVIEVPGATGLLDTNYEGKVDAALEFLDKGGDFVFVHLEGPDECGHSGIWEDKVEAIRRFDARVVAPLTAALPEAAFLVTCDHLTPLSLRTHCHDPVPFLLHWPGGKPTGVTAFNEQTAAGTGLHVGAGHQLITEVLNALKE